MALSMIGITLLTRIMVAFALGHLFSNGFNDVVDVLRLILWTSRSLKLRFLLGCGCRDGPRLREVLLVRVWYIWLVCESKLPEVFCLLISYIHFHCLFCVDKFVEIVKVLVARSMLWKEFGYLRLVWSSCGFDILTKTCNTYWILLCSFGELVRFDAECAYHIVFSSIYRLLNWSVGVFHIVLEGGILFYFEELYIWLEFVSWFDMSVWWFYEKTFARLNIRWSISTPKAFSMNCRRSLGAIHKLNSFIRSYKNCFYVGANEGKKSFFLRANER